MYENHFRSELDAAIFRLWVAPSYSRVECVAFTGLFQSLHVVSQRVILMKLLNSDYKVYLWFGAIIKESNNISYSV